MYKITALLSTTLFLSLATLAAEPSAHDFSKDSAASKALAAQRSGEIASTQEQHLSGKARSASYKRYVDSFAQPIPQSFIENGFTNE